MQVLKYGENLKLYLEEEQNWQLQTVIGTRCYFVKGKLLDAYSIRLKYHGDQILFLVQHNVRQLKGSRGYS